MMRNKEVTDYEINKTVAKYLKLNMIAYDRTGIVLFDDMDATPFDPCNNPADAMPIIIENKITVIYDCINHSWCAHAGYTVEECGGGYEIVPIHCVDSDSYYRAAMEVFLMMKDAENES
ncbi:phage protein NinX family protein [Morganella morganii]|uniref:phage protein NinX family protein n=1 Tax=Morganella morganii TaxID=582 RepID=UPI00311A7AD8